MKRVATAAVLLPLAWAVCEYASTAVFAVVIGALAALACWECYGILASRGARPLRWLGVTAALAACWSFALVPPRVDPLTVVVATTLLATVGSMWRRGSAEAMLDSAVSTVFPVLLVGLGLGHLVALRSIPGEPGHDLLWFLILCVIGADTFAYYAGRAFGRHPMSPVISPKKTWEGFAGAVAGSVVAALIGHFGFYRSLPLRHALVLAVVLCAAAVLGDLAESMVKRAGGVKDSSRILPGHGGIFDRLDSLLLAAPVLYYYYRVFLQGSP